MSENYKIIDANDKRIIPDFRELYRYRDLFLTLTWRDFRVRYAQTTIGLLWALIQPVVTLAILSLVFGRFVGVKTEVPHVLFTMTGMAIWTYFSFVMSNAGASIISNQAMVKKIYFPRLIIPLSKAAVGLIDLGISLIIMIVLMVWYGIPPTGNVWLAPFFLLMGMLAALAVGIWLSALTVRYRDFQHIVPFMVQIGLYITPIAYPADFAMKQLPSWAATLYYLNPMAGVIQGFRWSIFGGEAPGNLMYISFLMVLFILILGLLYFRKVEDEMADFV
ncbi:MAG: ABC transporter permease [Bacteroidota bacterium]|jgi:lipopolysaccharide transport system permease protein